MGRVACILPRGNRGGARIWAELLLCLCAALVSGCSVESGPRVFNLQGEEVDPFKFEEKGLVVIFVGTECPISNRLIPELKRMHDSFAGELAFRFVFPNRTDSGAVVRVHQHDFGYASEVWLDPSHRLVKAAQVRVTPEAALFARGGRLLYHGRVNDLYAAFGKPRPAPLHHDLRHAIDAFLAGKPVPPASGEAVGCSIHHLE
jgi:hypothetical protein